MSLRQRTPLILTSADGTSYRLAPVSLQFGRLGGGYDEAWIRDLVFAHPAALPVNEIEPSFGPLIPVCTELDTRTAGFADALFLNPLGMPTLVECKLWRNPEARREVVGQILDYASALRRTFVDLQREAARARRQHIVDLLVAMGYGGNRRDAAKRLGGTGDGGVDGVIDEDRLGLDRVYVQAKRYAATTNVGRPEVQGFVGSLVGLGATKGVFVTTSGFSQVAFEFVRHLSQRVILIDGQRLADLMI